MSNMVVQTNILALNSHRNMKLTGVIQSRASARLSSGYKINTAADDAAGLAISEKMRSQIRGLDMASKNAQDGQALVQTAEGGLQEIDNMIQRIRELVVQAGNDTNDQSKENKGVGDRQKLQDEIDQLVSEIDSMSDRVEFNKKKVISGSYADYSAMRIIASGNISAASYEKGLEDPKFAKASANYVSAQNSFASGTISAGQLNAYKDVFTTASNTSLAFFSYISQLTRAYSYADSLNEMGSAASATTLYFQIGANANQGINTNINRIKSDVLGIGDGNGVSKIDILENTGAAKVTGYLRTLDIALTAVTTERAKLGAISNRLDYTIKSLDVSSENLTDSESRIRDADMAKEMMTFTKTNVLQQAAISMLSQANQLPQNLLQLLR